MPSPPDAAPATRRLPGLLRSLHGQFAVAVALMLTLAMAGGGGALYALQRATGTLSELASERLTQMQHGQDLARTALLIAHQTDQLLAATQLEELDASYRRVTQELTVLDQLAPRLAATDGNPPLLDLLQAGQDFRALVHIVAQLRRGSLRSETEYADALAHWSAVLETSNRPEHAQLRGILAQLGHRHRPAAIADLRREALRLVAQRPLPPPLHLSANPGAGDSDPFALQSRLLQQQATLSRFHNQLRQQALRIVDASSALSLQLTRTYRDKVNQLTARTARQQGWAVIALFGALLSAVLVSRLFLGRHVVARLQRISEALRDDTPHPASPALDVGGRDEIADMARAVEQFLADRRQLAHTRASLEEERRRLAAIIDHSADGIVVVEDNRVALLNPAAAQLLGWRQEAVMGCAVAEWAPALAVPLLDDEADGQPHEYVIHRRDGSPLTVEMTVNHLLSVSARLTVAVIRDVSVRLAAERQLAAARDAAEATVRAQAAFLANISHEIRTPLNAVIGLTELLRQQPIGVDPSDCLAKIHDASHHLLRLLNDVLDFSKLEAGRMSLERVAVSLRALAQQAHDLFMRRAEEKGLSLQLALDDALPEAVWADSMRITQVLGNLLSNAIKFTNAGEVRLSVRCTGTPDCYRFEVQDTGIGIPQDQLARLFQPFAQADESTSRQYGGTGLGLAICHSLVSLMGSWIEVDSTPGQGATFSFELTLERAPVDAPQPRPLMPRDEDLARCNGMRVLVVEDNPVNLLVTRTLLTRCGVEVTAADNGEAALATIQPSAFDLVLMDIHMPGMDGIETARRLRANPAYRDLPIVAMTAAVTVQDTTRCKEVGMNDYLAKPFDFHGLVNVLLKWRAAVGDVPDHPEATATR